jgi:hypothetical protein
MSEKTIPDDFTGAVKDIKLAILQARARAARVSNVEALKLYFYVGGYISKKTRNAKWGSGAIDALSERLQVELPGLRGFSAQHIRFMRQFYEEWYQVIGVDNKVDSEIRYLPSSESSSVLIRQLPIGEMSQETVNKPVVELAVQGYSQPIGIATYRALCNIPEPYKTLAPVIDGVRRVLVEHGKEKRKSRRRKAK